MHLEGKKTNTGRINVFRDKQATTKVTPIFLNLKMLKEMQQRRFLDAVNQQAKYSTCI